MSLYTELETAVTLNLNLVIPSDNFSFVIHLFSYGGSKSFPNARVFDPEKWIIVESVQMRSAQDNAFAAIYALYALQELNKQGGMLNIDGHSYFHVESVNKKEATMIVRIAARDELPSGVENNQTPPKKFIDILRELK